MATTGTSTKPATKTGRRVSGRPGSPGPNGKGPDGNGHGRHPRWPRRLPPAAYNITAWIVIAGVVMMFAALSSAYIILSSGKDVPQVSVPRMFYASTLVIVLSSFSFSKAHRSLRLENLSGHRKWLLVTLVLGCLFLGMQLMGWRELAAQGVFFATHPHSSFFYLFTGLHGVHLMGGILALIYLTVTMRRSKQAATESKLGTTRFVERYWHAMDGIWIWLFVLLLIWA